MKIIDHRILPGDDRATIAIKGDNLEWWTRRFVRDLEGSYGNDNAFSSGVMVNLSDYGNEMWLTVFPDTIEKIPEILEIIKNNTMTREAAPAGKNLTQEHVAYTLQSVWNFNAGWNRDIPFAEPQDGRIIGEYQNVGFERVTKENQELFDKLVGGTS